MSMATEAVRTSAQHEWFADEVQALLPKLYGAAVKLCRDRTNAEDLVAEALTRAWAKLPTLADRGTFQGWLFRILTNVYISQYRAARVRPQEESLGADAGDFSIFERIHQPILLWWGNPEQEFFDGLLRADLQAALDSLPEPYRSAVVLVDVYELSYKDAGAALSVPVGTVRSRLSRGRALMQKHLWQYAGPGHRPAQGEGEPE